MKEGWEYKKLGEICDILNGFAFKSSTYVADGIRVIRISNVQKGKVEDKDPKFFPSSSKGEIENYLLNEGDLLISLTGNVGRVGILLRELLPAALNQRVACLRLKRDNIDKRYLFHFLNSDYFESICIKNSKGAAQLNMSTVWLSNYAIPIPSLSEQQRIVEYLDSAFAKIDAMKANAEKQLSEAKALFQASLKEMLEPKEGWEEKKLKDFATEFYRGSGVKRDQVTEKGVSCVRYGEIYTKYNYHFNKCDSYTLAEYVSSPKYFENGDILFAITGESVEEIGKSIAYTGNEKCIAGGDIVVMKHTYEPRYISYALSTPSAVKQKGRGKTKLKVVHTNIPSLEEIIIPIAPMNDQIRIADTLDSLKSKVDRLQANFEKISQECDALKQAILRKVFE